jgi:hypothetical protein
MITLTLEQPANWQANYEDDDFVVDDMFQLYTNKSIWEQPETQTWDVTGGIDEINANIVAKIDVNGLARMAPLMSRDALGLTVTDGFSAAGVQARIPGLRTGAERERYVRRKGVGGRPKKETARDLIRLWSVSKLYEPSVGDTADANAFAGAFCVPKSNGKRRIICDARAANSHHATSDSFTIFTIETLMRVVASLGVAGKNWYSVSADIRHCFHQIPLPERLRNWFVTDVTGAPPGEGEPHRLRPLASPMGWSDAPKIAQALVYAMLLARAKGNEQGEYLAKVLDVPLEYLLSDKLPSWIPLKSGGGIFVLIDNILVLTPRPEVATAWQQRIRAQTNRFNIVLKKDNEDLSHDERRARRGLNEQDKEAILLQTMTSEHKETLDFCGCDIQHDRCRVKRGDNNTMLGTVTEGRWQGTYRQLAAMLGKVLWWRRVIGTKLFTDEYVNLISLFGRVDPAKRSGEEKADWDRQMASPLTKSETEVLSSNWAKRAAQSWTTFDKNTHEFEHETRMAVDAATKSSMYGVVVYDEKEHSKAVSVFNGKHAYDDHIALAELQAIIHGVRAAIGGRTRVLVIGATDSLNAKVWVQRGYTTNNRARAMLQELDVILTQTESRLYLAYVATEDNVADDPSRGANITHERERATANLLSRAAAEANGDSQATQLPCT